MISFPTTRGSRAPDRAVLGAASVRHPQQGPVREDENDDVLLASASSGGWSLWFLVVASAAASAVLMAVLSFQAI